ncbi:MAG: molybdopterin-dependent oxidoreductase [Pseudomonadales bacterium]
MAQKTVKTYCRFCHAYCPMEATVEDNKLIAVKPDTSNPVYGGYTCEKGRQLVEQIYHPDRLPESQKRQEDGSFTAISSEKAMDEIAEQLQAIVAKYGPRSVASYNGTYSFQNSACHDLARAWHSAIDSPSYYTSITIDQPAKVAIAPARMGWWNAGGHMWSTSDVALIIGNNTLVSHYSMPGGIPAFSPSNSLREGKKRGVKVICVDPRKTEVASRADIHVQIKPGFDAALVSSIIRTILKEDLQDHEFCAEHIKDLDLLQADVERFTPELVAKAANIPVEQIYEVARTFAAGPRGVAVTGTGPEMGPHANLLAHLVQVLNSVCGRFNRAGEVFPNPGVLTAEMTRQAQSSPPVRAWLGGGTKSRISDDISEIFVLTPYGAKPEMPCAVIADEMLLEGDGQIKALICVGGNPLLAWPDQKKSFEALNSLDLLVCVDIKMAATAKLADYVIAPKICLEREDVTLLTDIWYEQPYSQYTQTVVEAEGDQIEEWELFWELGKRMGLDLVVNKEPLNMQEKPSKLDLLKIITKGSRVPIEEIAANAGGKVYPIADNIVAPADPATQSRMEMYPPDLDGELNAAFDDLQEAEADSDFSHILISRRMKNTYNSTGPELSQLGSRGTTNPAFINSQDLAELGISDGELIEVHSAHGRIPALAAARDDIKSGVVSMSHCWGDSPDPKADTDSKVFEIGSNTNRLVDNREHSERYTGMARQSCIPVTISKIAAR